MTVPQGTPASGTALQLLLTAERLLAEHGVAGVSLRQIATEAGSNNNSAVNYHFGSREGLLAAIFAYRLPPLQTRRQLLLDRCPPGELRARLEVHLLPMLEIAHAGEGAYLSFVEQLQRSRTAQDVFLVQADEHRRIQDAFVHDVCALLPDLTPHLRLLRVQEVLGMSLHAAAEHERAVSSGAPVPPFGLVVSGLLDGLTGYLQAPVSDEARRFLTTYVADGQPLLRLL